MVCLKACLDINLYFDPLLSNGKNKEKLKASKEDENFREISDNCEFYCYLREFKNK